MKLTWQRMQIKPAATFRTAKAVRTDKETIWVAIEHEGIAGWGEAVPMDTYHQTLESAEQTLELMAPVLRGRDPHDIVVTTQALATKFEKQLATVAAVDAALHDWLGKRFGIPTITWLGLSGMPYPRTSYTIGIDTPEIVAQKTTAALNYPILKVKVGTPESDAALDVIRKIAPQHTIRVDANQGWTVDEAFRRLPQLRDAGIEFVEQPVAAADLDGLRTLKEAAILPIFADESCRGPRDVIRLAGCVDGINIKLGKCGGIQQALQMIHIARALDMKIMLGCMIESSLGIAAAAQLAPLADYLDLDGHLLIRDDPFRGIGGENGMLTIGAGPGLGVVPAMQPSMRT